MESNGQRHPKFYLKMLGVFDEKLIEVDFKFSNNLHNAVDKSSDRNKIWNFRYLYYLFIDFFY